MVSDGWRVKGEYVRSGRRPIIQLVLQFEFVVAKTFGEKGEMSSKQACEVASRETKQFESQRQARKMDRLLKMIAEQTNEQGKAPKRQGSSDHSRLDPGQKKIVKTDLPNSSPIADQIISCPLEQPQPTSTAQCTLPTLPKQPSSHLNPAHQLPEEHSRVFDYLITTACAQQEKTFEKESQEWSILDSIDGKNSRLTMLDQESSFQLVRACNNKFKEASGSTREPLSKSHLQFLQKHQDSKN